MSNRYERHNGSINIGGPKHGEMVIHAGDEMVYKVRKGNCFDRVRMVRQTLMVPINVLVEESAIVGGEVSREVLVRAMNTICDLDAMSLKQLVRIKWLNTEDATAPTGAESRNVTPAPSAATGAGAPSPATDPPPTA